MRTLAHASPTPTARAQDLPPRPELFTRVEVTGWDLSSYDDKIEEAVTRASAASASGRSSRDAAEALAARGHF